MKVVGDLSSNRPLIVVSGNAGQYWAKGSSLGEQTGAVYVNDTQVCEKNLDCTISNRG